MLIVTGDTTRVLTFLMVDSTDHITPKIGLSPTVTISKNGGGFISPTGAIAQIGNGWYKVTPSAGDIDTLGLLIIHAESVGADPADLLVEVIAANIHNATSLGLVNLDTTVSSRAVPGATMGLVADAVNSSTLASSAISEIQLGLATLASITALNNLSATDIQNTFVSQGYTITRATNLDNLDVTVSSRAAPGTAMDLIANAVDASAITEIQAGLATSSEISSLNDLNQTDIQSAMTSQGFSSVRAGNLDNLNATVSSRSSHSASDVNTLITSAHGSGSYQTATGFVTSTELSALETNILADTNDIQSRLPALLISGKIDAYINSNLAEEVWDTLLAGHTNPGTAGEFLSSAGGGSSPSEIATAVMNSFIEGTITLKQSLRALLSVLINKSDIDYGRPIVLSYRDIDDTKDRVVVTYDNDQRVSITLDLT